MPRKCVFFHLAAVFLYFLSIFGVIPIYNYTYINITGYFDGTVCIYWVSAKWYFFKTRKVLNFNHPAPVQEFSRGSKQSSWWVPCLGPATLKYHAVSIEHIEVYVIKRVLCLLVQNEASQTRKWLKNVICRHIYKIRFFVFWSRFARASKFSNSVVLKKIFCISKIRYEYHKTKILHWCWMC